MGKPGSGGNGDEELDLGDKEKGSGGNGDEELDLGDKGKGSGGNGDLGDGENGSSGNGDEELDLGGGERGSGDKECGDGENGNGSGSVKADTGNVEKGVGNWENCQVLGDQKGGKHKETVPQDRDEPPSVGVITGVSGGEPHDLDETTSPIGNVGGQFTGHSDMPSGELKNAHTMSESSPWMETLAEKKSKIATIKESRGRGKSRGRGRGKSRGRGTGKGRGRGRGRGRAGASPVPIHPMETRHNWAAKDWCRSAHSIEGIANASRSLNYKEIIGCLEASDETEDKHLYNVLKNVTSMEYFYQMAVKSDKQTNNVTSDEQKNSDEQMGSAFGSSSTEELSKYFPNAQCNTTSLDTLNIMDSVCP